MRLEIECLNVASYHGGTESSGQVDFLDRKLPDVNGRCVLLIDDILDTGRTLAAVTEKLREMGAREVKTCVIQIMRRTKVEGSCWQLELQLPCVEAHQS